MSKQVKKNPLSLHNRIATLKQEETPKQTNEDFLCLRKPDSDLDKVGIDGLEESRAL